MKDVKIENKKYMHVDWCLQIWTKCKITNGNNCLVKLKCKILNDNHWLVKLLVNWHKKLRRDPMGTITPWHVGVTWWSLPMWSSITSNSSTDEIYSLPMNICQRHFQLTKIIMLCAKDRWGHSVDTSVMTCYPVDLW